MSSSQKKSKNTEVVQKNYIGAFMKYRRQGREMLKYPRLGRLFIFILCLCALFSRDSYAVADQISEKAREKYDNGVYYYLSGDYRGAIENLTDAMLICPRFCGAYYALGLSYLKIGQPKPAKEYFLRAIELNPFYAEAYQGLGDALYESSSSDDSASLDAIGAWEKALELETERDDSLILLLRIVKGNYLTGELDAAEKACRLALNVNPNSMEAHFAMGQIEETQGRIDMALREYREAISGDPNYLPAYGAIGDIYYLHNEIPETIRMYEKILAIDSSNCRAIRKLLKLYEIMMANAARIRDSSFYIAEQAAGNQSVPWLEGRNRAATDSAMREIFNLRGEKSIHLAKDVRDSLAIPGFLGSRLRELHMLIMVRDRDASSLYRYSEFLHVLVMVLNEKRNALLAKAPNHISNCIIGADLPYPIPGN
jgi:tetratricopeptide (TPR) repeat protein